MDPFFHTQAGDLLYMRRLVNDSSLWNLSLGDWFHNGTADGFLPMGIKVTIVIVYSIVCIVGLIGNCSVMYVIISCPVYGPGSVHHWDPSSSSMCQSMLEPSRPFPASSGN